MNNKNTVYTVTPPDLRMNFIGPSVLLLGTTLAECSTYISLYDKLFPEVEITFFVDEKPFDVERLAWYRAVVGSVSSVFVNIDNITSEEILMAMQAERDEHVLVFWISETHAKPGLVQLLNSYQYRIFRSMKEIETFLVTELNDKTD